MRKAVASAPGRVNIIGEHVDYNDGFVLPFAINRRTTVELSFCSKFIFQSEHFGKMEMEILEKTGKWIDYVIGVLLEIEKRKNINIPPLCVNVKSNLESGVGLSSSAALETAVAFAANELLEANLSKKEIVEISVSAERNFAMVNCGIMDQYTAVFGKKGFALLIDTKHETHEYIPLNLNEYKFYIIDSNVKHKLALGEYNKRREQAGAALKAMGKRSYREVTEKDLEKLNDEVLKKRAFHIIKEIERVKRAAEMLKKSDISSLGRLLYETHESLSKYYEVSCKETDFIVDFLKSNGVIGARMVGGGFGGGIIVLSKPGKIEEIYSELSKKYHKKFGFHPRFIEIDSDDGGRSITSKRKP